MPASGLASSANRTTGARTTAAGSGRKPMPATATKVRKGAIERAAAPATENITSGKLVLPRFERQSRSADDGAAGLHHIVNALCGELDLPVVGAVVPGVGAAAGVGHHDGITGVEVIEEPFRIGRADVDAAMTDVALALVIHRPWSAVDEVAAVIEADSELDRCLVSVRRVDRNAVGRGIHDHRGHLLLDVVGAVWGLVAAGCHPHRHRDGLLYGPIAGDRKLVRGVVSRSHQP